VLVLHTIIKTYTRTHANTQTPKHAQVKEVPAPDAIFARSQHDSHMHYNTHIYSTKDLEHDPLVSVCVYLFVCVLHVYVLQSYPIFYHILGFLTK